MRLLPDNRLIGKLKINVFYMSVITLMTVVVWIGFSVYQSLSKNTVDTSIQKLITPINPTLDTDTLSQFQQSRVTPPLEFQIITLIRKNNQPVQATLDPFNQTEISYASSAANIQSKASDSASLVEPDSEMIP